MNRKIITFIGEPGSGKSTIMNFLKDYKKICTAQLLLDNGYDVTKGNLIEDKIVVEIVLGKIHKINSNIILDGFPRTITQLNELVKSGIHIDAVYRICTPYNIIVERIKNRLTCVKCHESFTTSDFKKPKKKGICDYCGGKLIKRVDDDQYLLQKRLDVYKECTEPLINEYIKHSIKVINIDGTSRPDKILEYFKEK